MPLTWCAAIRANRTSCRNFLQAFDVDDGRVPCPMRTQTVTAPQALFMMNSDEIDKACAQLAERSKGIRRGSSQAVDLGYRITLARPPSAPKEMAYAWLTLASDAGRLKSFAWLLFNLDEFIYVR